MPNQITELSITEFVPLYLPANALAVEEAEALWRKFGTYVRVGEPGFANGYQWSLTSLGWVGYIPLTPTLHLWLQPRVPLGNLFRMLEVVYFKDAIRFLDGLYQADSLAEFYERLAGVLAKGILNRFRRGIYRAYEPSGEDLPFVRGRLDTEQLIQQPWRVGLPCTYEEHTADIEDNQIFGWTVQRVLRSGLCTGETLHHLRAAHRHLQGSVATVPFSPSDCLSRLYNRLNADYRPLHALCFFFLSETGPTHVHGNHTMLPFLVNMARLYERFVALWLKAKLEPRYNVTIQENHMLTGATGVSFDIDIVIHDPKSDTVRWILDTKYKIPQSGPSNDDIFQAITYATLKEAEEAILIYPVTLTSPLDSQIGNIRIRSLTFSLDGDLEKAGHDFLAKLFPITPTDVGSV